MITKKLKSTTQILDLKSGHGVKWAGRRVFSGATVLVGAAGGWSQGCVGGVRRRRVLPSGGACPQRISRQNEKFKNWKSKIKTERKTSARAPPHIYFGPVFVSAKWLGRSQPRCRTRASRGRPAWAAGHPAHHICSRWKRRIPRADEGPRMPTQFLQSVLASS
jgi:hypothetical protein